MAKGTAGLCLAKSDVPEKSEQIYLRSLISHKNITIPGWMGHTHYFLKYTYWNVFDPTRGRAGGNIYIITANVPPGEGYALLMGNIHIYTLPWVCAPGERGIHTTIYYCQCAPPLRESIHIYIFKIGVIMCMLQAGGGHTHYHSRGGGVYTLLL